MQERSHALLRRIRSVDEELVEYSEKPISRKRILESAAVGMIGTFGAKYMIRGILAGYSWFNLLSYPRRVSLELRFLSAFHSSIWVVFYFRNFMRSSWKDQEGIMRMFGMSLGFFAHNILKTMDQGFSLTYLDSIASIVALSSAIRNRSFNWGLWLGLDEIPKLPLHVGFLLWRLRIQGTLFNSIAAFAFIISMVVCRLFGMPFLALRVLSKDLLSTKLLWFKIAALVKIYINLIYWLKALKALRKSKTIAFWSMFRSQWLRTKLMLTESFWKSVLPLCALAFYGMFSYGYVVGAAFPYMMYRLYSPGPGGNWMRSISALGVGAFVASMAQKLPNHPPKDRPINRPIGEFLLSFVNDCIVNYHDMETIQEASFTKERRYLIVIHPHGILPMGQTDIDWKLRKQGFVPQIIGASILYKLPFLRQYFYNIGLVEANPESIHEALQRPYPSNITFIVPGGIAEMFCTSPDYELLVLSQRKGFVKFALMTGTDLVPTYYFGHTHMYKTPTGYVARVLQRLSRRLQVSVVPFAGRFGLMIPYPEKILGVVGKPIPVEKIENPTDEQVDAYHDLYISELRRIYNTYRYLRPGYEDKDLFLDGETIIPRKIPYNQEPSAPRVDFTMFPKFRTYVSALGTEDNLDPPPTKLQSKL